jgi:hypothetical protein
VFSLSVRVKRLLENRRETVPVKHNGQTLLRRSRQGLWCLLLCGIGALACGRSHEPTLSTQTHAGVSTTPEVEVLPVHSTESVLADVELAPVHTRHLDESVVDFVLGRQLCTLNAQGRVRCGGVRAVLYEVVLPEPAVALSAGSLATCALLASSGVACWGCKAEAQDSSSDFPEPTRGVVQLALPKMKSISVGGDLACGVTAVGRLMCWGELDVRLTRFSTWSCTAQRETFVSPARVETLALPGEASSAIG